MTQGSFIYHIGLSPPGQLLISIRISKNYKYRDFLVIYAKNYTILHLFSYDRAISIDLCSVFVSIQQLVTSCLQDALKNEQF